MATVMDKLYATAVVTDILQAKNQALHWNAGSVVSCFWSLTHTSK